MILQNIQICSNRKFPCHLNVYLMLTVLEKKIFLMKNDELLVLVGKNKILNCLVCFKYPVIKKQWMSIII